MLGVLPGIYAQGTPNDVHMTGTVSKIDGNKVTVSVADQSAEVVLLPTTTYKVGAKPAAMADLHVGDTVNALVLRANREWEAKQIRITHPKK
jgi:Cu/Ag efflux protein CusF